MDCLPVAKLPEGPAWTWEIKLDGWRMEAVKTGGRVTMYSRRGKNFNAQFGSIARQLAYLPDETVIDGEMVAVDDGGRPSFNLLQNFRSEESRIVYYVFDIPIHNGDDLMPHPCPNAVKSFDLLFALKLILGSRKHRTGP
jgi:bifunctional non-homologous end joining protein LigD